MTARCTLSGLLGAIWGALCGLALFCLGAYAVGHLPPPVTYFAILGLPTFLGAAFGVLKEIEA